MNKAKKNRSGQRAMNRVNRVGMAIKTVVVLLIGLTLASVAEAQQQIKILKIGYLSAVPDSGGGGARHAISRELETLGYVAGKKIVFESRYADNKLDRLPSLANELVGLKVDVLLASSNPAAIAAKNATGTIPIVFLGAGDPVALGLVDSLARPGGNVTGITSIGEVLAGKRLEILSETVPKLSRVAVLWNPKDAAAAQQWKESQFSARELGLQLHSMEVSSADKYESAFQEAMKARSTALAVTQHTMAVGNRKQIAELAAKNRLPAMYPREDFVDSGGLMSYGADRAEPLQTCCLLHRQNPKGIKAGRPAGRAADEV
jgi:putative tryptophan/tyrosine transport system substrate-binding protein